MSRTELEGRLERVKRDVDYQVGEVGRAIEELDRRKEALRMLEREFETTHD